MTRVSRTSDSDTISLPDVLPLLPVRDMVVFPYMIVPLLVSRDISRKAMEAALATDRLVLLAAQKEIADEDPTPEGVHGVGTIAMIMRVRKLSDGRVKLLVQGLARARIAGVRKRKPFIRVKVAPMAEPPGGEISLEAEALMRTARELLDKVARTGRRLPPDLRLVIGDLDEPGRMADVITSHLGLRVADAQSILELEEPVARLSAVNDLLRKEKAVQAMQQKLQDQVQEEMSRTQREYYLREQMRMIQQELGEGDERLQEMRGLRERIEKLGLPPEAAEEARRQLRRLEQMSPDAAEAAVLRGYLEWVAELPWSKRSDERIDLARAAHILDEDHHGLEAIKERILEHLGVCKLRGGLRGPILCFVGPPGVGKTSLGRSIARALGRSFVRQSLGGVRDEAEIRGHRRTYVGAMPGRILQGMRQAGTLNPVFVLDEIDKLGQDFRGDPSSALLEVLDPEQNSTFRDHYLNLPFDLSQTLFIATANAVDLIPAPLRDRMELLQLSGYTEDEKLAIARRHLLPRQLRESGLRPASMRVSNPALRKVVREYTREAGLRNLERELASLCRKVARRFAEGNRTPKRIGPDDVRTLLGPARYLPDPGLEEDAVGQVTGLAWTADGGEVLFVEASAMKGRSGLILTGQLGDVMKESAQAAMTWTRAHADELGIAPDFFATHELHIHVPAGAIPKDGPSAGVTMACALVSAASGRPVRRSVAMTGEITLRGRVLPVGGIKEKVLAAARHGIETVLVPDGNEKDLAEIPDAVRQRLELRPVRTAEEVLAAALGPAPAAPVAVLAPVRASS